MTREQMVEKAAEALHTPWRAMDWAAAETVLDAILPQITTVDELAALSLGTKLLGQDGEIWWRTGFRTHPFEGTPGGYGNTSGDFTEIAGRFLDHEGPLTVVWQP